MYSAAGNFAVPNDPATSGRFTEPTADSNQRTYALFNHLAGLISVFSGGLPFGGLIATAIVWRIKAKESPFLDDHGREAVNFQISQFVFIVGGIVAAALFSAITLGVGAIIVAPLAALGAVALMVLNIVGCVRGAIAANKGEYYRYPMCFRFISDDNNT